MAKRRTKKATAKNMGFKQILVSLGILFSVFLFIIKLFIRHTSWVEVFTPISIALFIVFLISVVKTAVRKI